MAKGTLEDSMSKEQRKFITDIETRRREELEKYVCQAAGKIKVDWQRLADDNKRNKFDTRYELPIYSDILYYLRLKGVLTCEQKGSFFVFGDSMDLSPSSNSGLSIYWFARQEDAKEYAKTEYAGKMYGVRVAKALTDFLNRKKD